MEFEERKGFLEQDPSKRKEIIRTNLAELKKRKEQGAIDSQDYESIWVYYRTAEGLPISLSDLKKNTLHENGQAINITQEELEILEGETKSLMQVVLADGSTFTINSKDTGYAKDDPLIIFPEELGEEEVKIRLKPDATLRDLFGALRRKEEEMIESGGDPDEIRFHEEVLDQFGDDKHLDMMDLMAVEEVESGQDGKKKDPRLNMKVREYFGDGDESYTNDDVEIDLPIEFEVKKESGK